MSLLLQNIVIDESVNGLRASLRPRHAKRERIVAEKVPECGHEPLHVIAQLADRRITRPADPATKSPGAVIVVNCPLTHASGTGSTSHFLANWARSTRFFVFIR